MSDNPSSLSTRTQARRRIAQAQAARPAVDHNGRPRGSQPQYVYDEAGHLVSINPPADE